MSVVRRGTVRSWALVVAVAVVAVLAPQVPRWLPGSAASVSPDLLRAGVLGSGSQAHQGLVEINGSLKLPELPRARDLTSLLTGTTRVRTWYESPSRWRFDVVSAVGERDVYGTPDGELTWDYGANLLTRVVGTPPVRLPRAGDLLPPDLARRVLSAAEDDPVSALPARRVAGREVPGLRLTPSDPATTIGHMDMWVDPGIGLPVAVEVSARGVDRPVLVSRFLELSATPPGADVLTPKQSRGSGLSIMAAPDVDEWLGALGRGRSPARLAGRELREADVSGVRGVGVYGTGLSAFVALPVPRDIGAGAAEAVVNAGGTREELPRGEALHLSIAPLSVVVVRSEFARRWYLLAGLTTTDVLLEAAGELALLSRTRR
ncbi:MAG: hypothetical protein GEV28_20095 [Actinophytocola sp.]|uniref:hypothetical protein n=1 Tax=Actinophytocola sp. TaxID=1872138 RepID=UPI00132AFBEB|nr:hypothetical protein [Actinophytocola sp.]MPZ82573.1 hypothetical protein [Actinophytocola sp.]